MNSFTKNILWFLLLICITSWPNPVTAGKAAINAGGIHLLCPLNGGRIGDPIAFVLQVQLAKGAVMDPSSLSRIEIRPLRGNGQALPEKFFRSELDPFDHLILSAKKHFTIRGIIHFYAPGEYRLAPVSIVCRLTNNSHNQPTDNPDKFATSTITSNSVNVQIAGLQSDSTVSPALIIPEKEPRFKLLNIDKRQARYRAYCIALALSLLLTIIFAGICYNRRKNTSATEIKSEDDRLKEIIEALKLILKRKKVEPHWRYLIDLDHLLRSFLLAEFKLPEASFGGRGATFIEHLPATLDLQMITRLQHIWSKIDRIVALEIEKYQDFSRLRQQLKTWLREYADKKGARYGF